MQGRKNHIDSKLEGSIEQLQPSQQTSEEVLKDKEDLLGRIRKKESKEEISISMRLISALQMA